MTNQYLLTAEQIADRLFHIHARLTWIAETEASRRHPSTAGGE